MKKITTCFLVALCGLSPLVLATDYMDLAYFWGKVTVDNVTYTYKGEFTGGPLDRPENQGVIIRFTTE